MKITTWNCKYSFTKNKVEKLLVEYDSDLFFIQECKDSNRLLLSNYFTYSCWYGDNKEYNQKTGLGNLGIGIFSNKYCMSIDYRNNRNIRYFVPVNIFDDHNKFTAFAVWTKNDYCKKPYIGQVIEGLNDELYSGILTNSIVIGDFNTDIKYSNEETIFSNMLNDFSKYKLTSAYHKYNEIDYGNENRKTYYNKGHKRNGFIDYCFIPENCIVNNVSCGQEYDWYHNPMIDNDESIDHVPIQFDIQLTTAST